MRMPEKLTEKQKMIIRKGLVNRSWIGMTRISAAKWGLEQDVVLCGKWEKDHIGEMIPMALSDYVDVVEPLEEFISMEHIPRSKLSKTEQAAYNEWEAISDRIMEKITGHKAFEDKK